MFDRAALAAPALVQQRQPRGGVWLSALFADIIRAVRWERSFSVGENRTGARPLRERTKLTARRVAARDAAEVVPGWQRESLPVYPVPSSSPEAKLLRVGVVDGRTAADLDGAGPAGRRTPGGARGLRRGQHVGVRDGVGGAVGGPGLAERGAADPPARTSSGGADDGQRSGGRDALHKHGAYGLNV